jgi:uncharacterized spore protein YtfJ
VITDPAARLGAAPDGPIASEPSGVVRFRYAPSGSGVSRSGLIRPGARLIIAYDPTRLANTATGTQAHSAVGEILAHVRFHPGGQTASGPLAQPAASDGATRTGAPAATSFAIMVPDEATQVEVWFERRGGAGAQAWDSRYGQNFWFDVDRSGLAVPHDSVAIRTAAVVDPGMVGVVADAVAKERTPAGASGSRVVTRMTIEARIRDAASARAAWADVHVFDGAEERVHAATVPLDRRAGDDEAAQFVWDDAVYQGSGGGSGVGVAFRPDAHLVQYRVYGEVHGQVFTDGVLHQLALPPDQDIGT